MHLHRSSSGLSEPALGKLGAESRRALRPNDMNSPALDTATRVFPRPLQALEPDYLAMDTARYLGLSKPPTPCKPLSLVLRRILFRMSWFTPLSYSTPPTYRDSTPAYGRVSSTNDERCLCPPRDPRRQCCLSQDAKPRAWSR